MFRRRALVSVQSADLGAILVGLCAWNGGPDEHIGTIGVDNCPIRDIWQNFARGSTRDGRFRANADAGEKFLQSGLKLDRIYGKELPARGFLFLSLG